MVMQDPLTPSLTSWHFPPVSLKRMALQRRIHPWCFADFHGQLEKPFKLYNVYQTERSVFNMVATTRGFWNFPNFPWPTELTISHISPENELSHPLHPFINAFSKSRAVYMNWLFLTITCKKDSACRSISWKIFYQHNMIHVRTMYKGILNVSKQ